MENWQVISVDCSEEFDPKIVRVTILVAGIHYGIDIPSNLYPEIGASLGWPTNPCTE